MEFEGCWGVAIESIGLQSLSPAGSCMMVLHVAYLEFIPPCHGLFWSYRQWTDTRLEEIVDTPPHYHRIYATGCIGEKRDNIQNFFNTYLCQALWQIKNTFISYITHKSPITCMVDRVKSLKVSKFINTMYVGALYTEFH